MINADERVIVVDNGAVNWCELAAALPEREVEAWQAAYRREGDPFPAFCPECGHRFSVRFEAALMEALLSDIPAFVRPFSCRCQEAHPETPPGESGCGRSWLIGFTRSDDREWVFWPYQQSKPTPELIGKLLTKEYVDPLYDSADLARGRQQHGRAELRFSKSHSSDARDAAVSIHESYHQLLNEYSAWGQLISVVEKLIPIAGERLEFEHIHRSLLAMSKTVHETYASYLTSQVGYRAAEEPKALGEDYPLYRRYFELAEGLFPSIRAGLLNVILIDEALNACMNSPIIERVLEVGIGNFPLDVPTSEQPDERLYYFGPRAAEIGDRVISACNEELSEVDQWHAISEGNLELLLSLSDAEVDMVRVVVYRHLAKAMRDIGLPTVELSELSESVLALVHAIEKDFPGAIDSVKYREQYLLPNLVRSERLLFRSGPLTAKLLPVSALVGSEDSLLLELSSGPTFCVLIRTAGCVRSQFRILPKYEPLLPKSNRVPVAMIRVADGDESRGQGPTFAICGNPAEVVNAANASEARFVVSSVSATIYFRSSEADRAWFKNWIYPLHQLGSIVVLIDVDIAGFLGNWSKRVDPAFKCVPCEMDGLTTLVLNTAHGDHTAVAPCSPLLLSQLLQHIEESHPQANTSSPEVLEYDKRAVRVALSLLDWDEWYFSFDGRGGF